MRKSATLVSVLCLLGFINTGCGGPVDETQLQPTEQSLDADDLSVVDEDQSAPEQFASNTMLKTADATAVFNYPTHDEAAKVAIVTHITSLIARAKKDSVISVSMYAFNNGSNEPIALELMKAKAKGVHVRVVIDGNYAQKETALGLEKVLNANVPKTDPNNYYDELNAYVKNCNDPSELNGKCSYLLPCKKGRACISGAVDSINHNKFYLFSTLEGPTEHNVVVQSSANVTKKGTHSYWNNAVTLVGAKSTYGYYLNYFKELSRGKYRSVYNSVKSAKAEGTQVQFFPQDSNNKDPIIKILDEINCNGNSPGYGNGNGHTIIRIAAFSFLRNKVAKKLVGLAEQKCDVRIVCNDMDNDVKKILRHDNIKLIRLDDENNLVHSKYLLINGGYYGAGGNWKKSKWVFTGSHNLDEHSLSMNDETVLRLRSDNLHDQYVHNFNAMWNAAEVLHPAQ